MHLVAITRQKVQAAVNVILFLLALSSAAACDIMAPDDLSSENAEPGDLKVLFIGSSYLDVNNMPGIFRDLAEAAGKEVLVAGRVLSGHYLDFFAQDPVTARAIRAMKWDYVVLSGGCQTAAYPDTHHLIMSDWKQHDPLPALDELKRKVRENHRATVLIYMMPWAFEDGMTWIPGQGDDYFEMQRRIRDNALAWAEAMDLVVAPVGMAWKEVLEWGVPEHYLHMSDWNHPAPRGSFLSAATIFSTVFEENSESVDYSWVLTDEDAAAFRGVASRTVLDSLGLWNITP